MIRKGVEIEIPASLEAIVDTYVQAVNVLNELHSVSTKISKFTKKLTI